MTRAGSLVRTMLGCLALAASPAAAQGVQTHVALPVAAGEGILRAQVRVVRASRDTTGGDRRSTTWLSPWTLAAGITPDFTFFATLPLRLDTSVRLPTGRSTDGFAVGNPDLLLRYTVFREDPGPLATRRLAILAGVSLPVGADRFARPTFDPSLGAVGTWARDRLELDVDALYTVSSRRQGFRNGAGLRYDTALRFRLWPSRFGRGSLQIAALLELNGSVAGHSRLRGRRIPGSGGHSLFVAPGLHLATRRAIVEASVQLPLHRHRDRGALRTDWSAVLSLRIPFALPGP